MPIYKQIDADQAAELTDSVVVSVAAATADRITASVSWSTDGDVDAHSSPMPVPEALDLARARAVEAGKGIVYVELQSDSVAWDAAWGGAAIDVRTLHQRDDMG